MRKTAAIAGIICILALPAAAQAPSLQSLTEGGRYALLELNDQVVRLDTDTGTFSLCRMEADVWSCTVTIDERQILEDRIAVLSKRIDALERGAAQRLAGTGQGQSAQQDAPLPLAAERRADAVPTGSAAGGTTAPTTQNGLPPLDAPRTVTDQPEIREDFAAPQDAEPERKGFVRRLTGLLPFVD